MTDEHPRLPELRPSLVWKYSGKLTPEQFELLVLERVREKLDQQGFRAKVAHRELMRGVDGDYEIDITLRFDLLHGASVLVLVECKYHNHPIKRDVIVLLRDKVSALGAHKGIVYSTAPYQTGAVTYARAHGIALFLLERGSGVFNPIARSTGEVSRSGTPSQIRCLSEGQPWSLLPGWRSKPDSQ